MVEISKDIFQSMVPIRFFFLIENKIEIAYTSLSFIEYEIGSWYKTPFPLKVGDAGNPPKNALGTKLILHQGTLVYKFAHSIAVLLSFRRFLSLFFNLDVNSMFNARGSF